MFGLLLETSALGLILATHVTTGFAPARVKAVTAPVTPAGGVARVVLPGSPSTALSTPFALIVRVENNTAEAVRFDVRVDGAFVCSREAGGGRPARFDCVVEGPWDPRISHAIDIAGPADAAWALTYLESATHHGASRGYDFVVVPAGFEGYARPTRASMTIVWLGLAALFLLPRASWPRAAMITHRAASVVLAALGVVVFVSGYLSPYSILLSFKTFCALAAVLAAPRLWAAGEWIWRRPATRARRLLAGVATGLVVLGTYGLVIQQRLNSDYQGNHSGFVRVARATFERHPVLSSRDDVRRSLQLVEGSGAGYDAQFMYYAAFDPLLRAFRDRPEAYGLFIDAPPYRYGRIGFALLIRIVAGSRWRLYPATMVWTILFSISMCGIVLGLLAHAHGANAGWGLLTILIPGFWQSAQFALPEPLAAGLLLAGFLLVRRDSLKGGAILFSASLLVRETGAVFVAIAAAGLFLSNRRRDAAWILFLSIVPLIAWRIYVGTVLAPVWGAQAFWFNPGNLGVPFGGFIDLWSTIGEGSYYPDIPAVPRAAIGLAVLLSLGVILAGALAVRMPGVVTVAALLYGVMAVSLTYVSIWVHVGNAQRGTYELFVLLALACLQRHALTRGLRLAVAAFWVAAGGYTFFGAYDAEYVRNAIL